MIAMLVTKIGGSIATDAAPVLDELARRETPVLVHGFGPQTTRRAEQTDVEPRWIRSPQGVTSRFTDEDTLAIMQEAADEVADRLSDGLAQREVPHTRVQGSEGLLAAEAKPALRHQRGDGRTVLVRGNRSGRVSGVDPSPIEHAREEGRLALVTPLARDASGLVSVDADRAAAAIAAALGADELVLLTDVPRVHDEHGEPIHTLPVDRTDELREAGALSGGMLRKLVAAREALEAGIATVWIADGTRAEPIDRARAGHATEVVPA